MTTEDYGIFIKHFKKCREQLTQYQQKAPTALQSKISIAMSSLTAAETKFEEKKDLEEVLYLLGRVHWTLGFVFGQPKEKPARSLAEVFSEEGEENEETPIADALLRT